MPEGFANRNVGAGITVKDAVMYGGIVISGVVAFYLLHGDVRVLDEKIATHIEGFTLAQAIQATNDKAQDAQIQKAQDATAEIHTSQEVLKATTKRTESDVKEIKALLNDVARSVQEISRRDIE